MNRRKFLKMLGIGGIGIALGDKLTSTGQNILPDANKMRPLGNTGNSGDIKLTSGGMESGMAIRLKQMEEIGRAMEKGSYKL